MVQNNLSPPIRIAITLLLSVVILPLSALAQQSPSEVLNELYGKLKASGDPIVIVDYIDWEGDFQKLPEEQRSFMKIKNANDLRDYYRKLLDNPVEYLGNNMMPFVETLPESEQEEARKEIQKVIDEMRVQLAKDKKELKELEFKVGKAKIDENSATVSVTTTVKGSTKTQDVTLRKVNEKWLLPSAQGIAPGIGTNPQGMTPPPVK